MDYSFPPRSTISFRINFDLIEISERSREELSFSARAAWRDPLFYTWRQKFSIVEHRRHLESIIREIVWSVSSWFLHESAYVRRDIRRVVPVDVVRPERIEPTLFQFAKIAHPTLVSRHSREISLFLLRLWIFIVQMLRLD